MNVLWVALQLCMEAVSQLYMPEQHAIGQIISNVVRVGSNCYIYMNECVAGCVAVVHGRCLAPVYVETCMRSIPTGHQVVATPLHFRTLHVPKWI